MSYNDALKGKMEHKGKKFLEGGKKKWQTTLK